METRIAHGMRLDWLLKLLHKARRDKLLFGGKRQCSEPEMGRADEQFVNDFENSEHVRHLQSIIYILYENMYPNIKNIEQCLVL